MKSFLLCLIMISSLQYSSCQVKQDKKLKNPQPAIIHGNTLNIKINTGEMKPVNTELSGFNTANTFGNMNSASREYIDLVEKLNPSILRFPGGSIANFYHPDGKGYGFREKDFVLNDGSVSTHVHNMLKKNQKVKSSENYLNDFTAMALKLKSEVLYIANITSGTPEELINILQHFQKNSIPVKGVVLGNELYLNGYKQLVPDAADFKKRAMPFVNAVRKFNSKIPIAIPAESRGMLRESYRSDWNNELSGEKFYDAIVVHIYPDEPKCPESNLNNLFNCSKDALTGYVNNLWPVRMSYFAEQFAGKKIWITEWNLKKPGKNIGSTLLQALYAADFLLEVSEWNSINNRIDLLSYHNLSSDEYGYSLINPEKDNLITNSAYYTFKIFASVNGNSSRYSSGSQNDIKYGIYYDEKLQKVNIIILNYSNSAMPFKFTMDNLNLTPENWERIQGSRLYATNQTAGFIDNIRQMKDADEISKTYNSFKTDSGNKDIPLEVPAYSLTRITYQVSP